MVRLCGELGTGKRAEWSWHKTVKRDCIHPWPVFRQHRPAGLVTGRISLQILGDKVALSPGGRTDPAGQAGLNKVLLGEPDVHGVLGVPTFAIS